MSTKAATPPASTDVASLQVSLPQMLDLALGTPEVGAVNLNLLHNFLHILLHEINLRSTKVEYRGDDANRIKTMVNSLQGGPTLYLQEYSIIDESNNEKQRVLSDRAANVTVDVVTEESATVKKTKGAKQTVGPGKEGEYETVIFVEPIMDGATPTALGFRRLEQTVNELQQRFQALEDLATTPELVERIKGKITDPVSDVWQIINITKRLDATEEGIEKLTKVVQDVIKGDATIAMEGTTPSDIEQRLANFEEALSNLDHLVKNLQVIANGYNNCEDVEGQEGGSSEPNDQTREEHEQSPAQRVSLTQLLGGVDVKEMQKDVDRLQDEVGQMRKDLKNLDEKIIQASTGLVQKTDEVQESGQKEQKTQAQKESVEEEETGTETGQTEAGEAADTREKMAKDKAEKRPATPKDTDKVSEAQSPRSPAKAAEADTAIGAELQIIKERISKLEKELSCFKEKMEGAPMTGGPGSGDLDDLVSKIQEIQAEMEKLNQTADRLIDDRENRELHLNALLEQVELLKTIKADREDLEEALADKADAQAINRKVSYDQFDAACDDLAQGLEDAIGKLGKQETIWQEALEEVQKEIEGKVDKIEISPLKEFVNHRLKSLQDKLKKVADAREENEAAGTKKMLRDVQCISCDKDVVMRMDGPLKFKVDTLPCTMSMKPYLTYELDQVRKQRKRLPHSRNMIQFEAAIQEEARKQRSARTEKLVKTPRDHLCNRYCGGSHTITTPQQRVMRMGHFLTQWGPEIVQLTEGMVKGTDGKMYKSRRMPAKMDVCGPAYCENRTEDVQVSDRTSLASVPSRKPPEKQASSTSKKRSVRRLSREVVKEVIEELTESPAADTDGQDSVDVPLDHGGPMDRAVHYTDDEDEDI